MKRSSNSRLQGRRGRPASPPDKDICRGRAALGMLVAVLRPGAVDRVEGQPCLARHLCLICGDDADGGLIVTEAHATEVGQSIRSAKAFARGRALPTRNAHSWSERGRRQRQRGGPAVERRGDDGRPDTGRGGRLDKMTGSCYGQPWRLDRAKSSLLAGDISKHHSPRFSSDPQRRADDGPAQS
jgi:hypothetical protein